MYILKQINNMIINNTYSSRRYSTSVKLPKQVWTYLCAILVGKHIHYEILPFNWEHFWRSDKNQEVYVQYWSKIKAPIFNYNSNDIDSHIYYVCSTCWMACHRLKNPKWLVSTYHKWLCGVCYKNTYVTEKRDFNFPDFTEYRKTLTATCTNCDCNFNPGKEGSDLFCKQCQNEWSC